MKSILSIVLLFLLANVSIAQKENEYERFKDRINYFEGYILNKDSVKKEGLVKDQDGVSLSDAKKKFINFVSKNGKKYKLYPRDIKGYGLSSKKYVSDGKRFLEIIKLGKQINLYRSVKDRSFLNTAPPGSVTTSNSQLSKTTYYFQKIGAKDFKKVERHKFQKRFMEYFADCIHLQAKIINQELGFRDPEKIVAIYNGCPLQEY